jgi:hypothetical protein
MIKTRQTLVWMTVVLVAFSAHAVSAHHPISVEQVVSALNSSGLSVTSSQVMLPGPVVAVTSTPVLNIRSIHPMSDRSTVVRLECEDSSECLPFDVRLLPDKQRNQVISVGMPGLLAGGNRSSRSPILVRPGMQAVLLLEGQHMQIRIRVVCIENGSLGDTVRARGNGNRQIYTAEVVDTAVLRGRL